MRNGSPLPFFFLKILHRSALSGHFSGQFSIVREEMDFSSESPGVVASGNNLR